MTVASPQQQPRKPHVLSRRSDNRLPSTILCVASLDSTLTKDVVERGYSGPACVPRRHDTAAAMLLEFDFQNSHTAFREYLIDGHADIGVILTNATTVAEPLLVLSLGTRDLWDGLNMWRLFDDDKLSLTPPEGAKDLRGYHPPGIVVMDDPPTMIEAYIAGTVKRFRWLDVRNYGLAGWAEMVLADQANAMPWLPRDDSQASARLACSVRVKYLADFAAWYRRSLSFFGLGAWANALAAQAWHAFRRRWMRTELHVHDDIRTLEKERDSYYPGRCEVYLNGSHGQYLHTRNLSRRSGREESTIYHLDVAGLYTDIALNLDVPVELHSPWMVTRPGREVIGKPVYQALAEVQLDTDVPLYPRRIEQVGDYATKWWEPDSAVNGASGGEYGLKPGDVIWPVGKVQTTLCWPELQQAIRRGHLVNVLGAAWYRVAPALSCWAEFWQAQQLWAATTKEGGVNRKLVKMLPNMLYGRMARWHYPWIPCAGKLDNKRWAWWYATSPATGKLTSFRTLDGQSAYAGPQEEDRDSMPAVAAWIASAARVRLWELVEAAGRYHVFYVDTDSLFVDQTGLDALVQAGHVKADTPGKLRVVDTHNWCQWVGIRHYVADGRRVLAGATPGCQVADGFVHTGPHKLPLKAELGHGHAPKAVEVWTRQSVHVPYRHGTVMPDYSVEPLVAKDW